MARKLFRYLMVPNPSRGWNAESFSLHLERLTGVSSFRVVAAASGFEVELQAELDVARLFMQLVKPHMMVQILD